MSTMFYIIIHKLKKTWHTQEEHDEKKLRSWNSSDSSGYLLQVVLTYNISAIKMTPSEPRKEKKSFKVKMYFRLGSKRSRVYPALIEGDQVEIKRKKGLCEKERSSHWLRKTFTQQKLKRDPDRNVIV